MKLILLLAVVVVCETGLYAQAPVNQTTQTIKNIKNLFSRKRKDSDSAAFLGNPSLGNLSGHWKGTYLLDRPDRKYDYDLYLYKTSSNTYSGMAESRGMPLYRETRESPTIFYMPAAVTIIVNDTTKFTDINIRENAYLANGYKNEFMYWPLKRFRSELVPVKKGVKLTGVCNDIMDVYYTLTLYKESDSIEADKALVLHSLQHPEVTITEISFLSEKNEAFLGYMEAGRIKFIIRNIGHAITPSLVPFVEILDENEKPVDNKVVSVTGGGLGPTGIEAGKTQGCLVSLKASDRIMSTSLKVRVSILRDQGQRETFTSTIITIPVKQ